MVINHFKKIISNFVEFISTWAKNVKHIVLKKIVLGLDIKIDILL
jgi:hypothetical protein